MVKNVFVGDFGSIIIKLNFQNLLFNFFNKYSLVFLIKLWYALRDDTLKNLSYLLTEANFFFR